MPFTPQPMGGVNPNNAAALSAAGETGLGMVAPRPAKPAGASLGMTQTQFGGPAKTAAEKAADAAGLQRALAARSIPAPPPGPVTAPMAQ